MDELNLYNLNAPNYSLLNWRYDYFSLIQNRKFITPVKEIMAVDFYKGIHTGNFLVHKLLLPNGNVAWKISSSFFKHYYAFLLNPIVKDDVVIRDDMKIYTNVCLKCEETTSSFNPLKKRTYMGVPEAVYICPKCEKSNTTHLRSSENSLKSKEPNNLENEIGIILTELGISYEREKGFNLGYMNKIADFYIPCGKVIIEGNGIAYHTKEVSSKYNSKYGKEAFFVNVMKDVISAYELTSLGYYVYIITDADLIGEQSGSIGTVSPSNINREEREFIKNDLYQLLSYRGCKPNIDFNVWNTKI